MITNIHKSHILTRKKTYLSIGVGIPKKVGMNIHFHLMIFI